METPEGSNLISSEIKGTTRHRILLDIDFPAALIPSSTPGHSHLYIDKQLTQDEMEKLVFTLHEVGLLADGNANQWHKFKAQFLRLPWVKKEKDEPEKKALPKVSVLHRGLEFSPF
jgi:hypothetical protein